MIILDQIISELYIKKKFISDFTALENIYLAKFANGKQQI